MSIWRSISGSLPIALVPTADWRARGARPHPMGRLDPDRLQQVLEIVGQILGFDL